MKQIFMLLCLVATTLFATSQGIKLKITGITAPAGEDVIAFETSDTVIGSSTGGSGGGTGITNFEVVKIKKLSDVSTNELFRRSIGNIHTSEATFEFSDNTGTLFYKIVIKDFTVNHFSYLSPECSGCAKLYHQLWFDYAMIEVTDVIRNSSVKYNRKTKVFY